MDAYIYRAALYCGLCAEGYRQRIIDDFHEQREDQPPGSWFYEDSECWPQGPYAEGGGESDSPQHCDKCGIELDNPVIPQEAAQC